jgi:hypothetical protein
VGLRTCIVLTQAIKAASRTAVLGSLRWLSFPTKIFSNENFFFADYPISKTGESKKVENNLDSWPWFEFFRDLDFVIQIFLIGAFLGYKNGTTGEKNQQTLACCNGCT